MNRVWIVFLLAASTASAASWESFPLRDNGSVAIWSVAGPLPNVHLMGDGTRSFGYFKDWLKDAGGETAVVPVEGDRVVSGPGKTVTWKTAFSQSDGLLDFIRVLKVFRQMPGVTYAFCQLVSDDTKKVCLKVRSNDGVRVWFND